eukprot:CAMPEP_0195145638 /NCGR_PEP_ID=MMETSP0448-20130528/170176_1 /TAXON_ID=66468 /ORGANISM="Heterocapsa triquestra, Strain CCMP 448" /LENGTH=131 /DNA_ID=CAMNT_0040184155 /DNA_START=36 /DNA_END=427 /DNA_ORIENTATION=+
MTITRNRHCIVKAKALIFVVLGALVTACGYLELDDLLKRSKWTLRAISDDMCYVHLYPYSSTDHGYSLELKSSTAGKELSVREAVADIFKPGSLKISGAHYGLEARECPLHIVVSNDSHHVTLYTERSGSL